MHLSLDLYKIQLVIFGFHAMEVFAYTNLTISIVLKQSLILPAAFER